jgi:replicative DNA helicase Mcm
VVQESVQRDFETFFSERKSDDILSVARKGEQSVEVDIQRLDNFQHELGDALADDPEDALRAARKALDSVEASADSLDIRLVNPYEDDFVKLRNLRSKHIGRLIPVEGMIKRASQVKPELKSADFECQQCGNIEREEQDSSELKSPYKCEECGSRKFQPEEKNMTDTQVVTLEETPDSREGSEQPATLSVRLEGDLVDPEFQKKVVPGNEAMVIGTVREKPVKKNSNKFDIYMDANNLVPTQQEFEELEIEDEEVEEIKSIADSPDIFDTIIDSIAPSIFGHREIKKAIALQLFGGVKKTREDGVKSRGDIHILLIGEPGTGKSQMLEFAGQLAPKGRYVVGKSSTGAGLTASVVKEESTGDFSLEAGAVVLAHKGMAAIDEIDKMSKEDRSSLHEAMEQQQISISKANIQATLNAETGILAAGNPKLGRFDPYEPIPQQIDIGDTLLSRFDFIFPVKDEPDEERDTKLSEQVLQNHIDPEDATADLTQSKLRKYIAYSKRIDPDLTQEAADKIQDFYVDMRKRGEGEQSSVPITARQLEALIRIAEASARAELEEKATEKDADRAIDILTHCLEQVGVDPETGEFDADIIESGVSGSERNRQQTIKHIIDSNTDKNSAMDIETVLDKAEDSDIDRQKAEEIIEKMQRQGELFEPEQGKVKKL